MTSTIRNIATCIPVGTGDGIDHDSVAAFDNLATVPKSVLTTRLGTSVSMGANRFAMRSTPRLAAEHNLVSL